MAIPSVTTVVGTRGTGNILANRLIRDVDNEIAYWEPSADPYTSIMMKMKKKRSVKNPKFEWQEDQQVPHFDTIDEDPAGYAADAGVTAFTFDNAYIRAGDILLHPTGGEYVRVTNFASNIATVVRNYGSAGLTTWADGLEVLIIGDVQEEGFTTPDDITTQIQQPYNVIQIIDTSVDVTDTESECDMYGGADEKEQLKKALIRHKMKIERANLFGIRVVETGVTHPRRMMRGLVNWIQSNVSAVGATFTELEFEAMFEALSPYSIKKEWVLFVGAAGVGVMGGWIKDKIRIIDKSDTERNEYGFTYSIYNSIHGRVEIVEDNQLANAFSGHGFAMNMDNVRYVHLKNSDTKLRKNIQNKTVHKKIHEYLSKVSNELKLEISHGLFTGIVG